MREEIREAGLYHDIWQAFAVLLPVRSVGVMGDKRTYAWPIVLRCVSSEDGMTADSRACPTTCWKRFQPHREQEGGEPSGADITSKPPGTIENKRR